MSYHLYHTPALILGSAPQGEGSKTISLFTRELGFLSATAQSVREERSKLRYGLQDFSYSDVTLVRGKEFWRLTNAELITPFVQELRGEREAIRMLGRICALLRRLLTGEEKNEPLFQAVVEGFQFLQSPLEKPARRPVRRSTGGLAGGGALHSDAGGLLAMGKTTPASEDRGTPFIKGDKSSAEPFGARASAPPLGKEEQIAAVEIVLVLRILYFLGYLANRDEFDPFLSHVGLWDESVISKALLFRTLAISEINQSLKASQL